MPVSTVAPPRRALPWSYVTSDPKELKRQAEALEQRARDLRVELASAVEKSELAMEEALSMHEALAGVARDALLRVESLPSDARLPDHLITVATQIDEMVAQNVAGMIGSVDQEATWVKALRDRAGDDGLGWSRHAARPPSRLRCSTGSRRGGVEPAARRNARARLDRPGRPKRYIVSFVCSQPSPIACSTASPRHRASQCHLRRTVCVQSVYDTMVADDELHT